MRCDVGELNIDGCWCDGIVIIGRYGSKGMQALSRGSGCTHSSVIAFVAQGVWPMNIDSTRPYILRIRIVGKCVECDGVLNFYFRSGTENLNLRVSVGNKNIHDGSLLIFLLISHGNFNWVVAVIHPCPTDCAGLRRDRFPCPVPRTIVVRDFEFTGHSASIFVKTFIGREKQWFQCHCV